MDAVSRWRRRPGTQQAHDCGEHRWPSNPKAFARALTTGRPARAKTATEATTIGKPTGLLNQLTATNSLNITKWRCEPTNSLDTPQSVVMSNKLLRSWLGRHTAQTIQAGRWIGGPATVVRRFLPFARAAARRPWDLPPFLPPNGGIPWDNQGQRSARDCHI
jgi:hypothetical protein